MGPVTPKQDVVAIMQEHDTGRAAPDADGHGDGQLQ
jgi:hypothetical protein